MTRVLLQIVILFRCWFAAKEQSLDACLDRQSRELCVCIQIEGERGGEREGEGEKENNEKD
jgi:hypothetical protein